MSGDRIGWALGTFIAILGTAAGSLVQAGPVEMQAEPGKVTVSRGTTVLVFDAAGGGFITSAKRGDAEVGGVQDAGGLFASLVLPEAAARPLEPIRGAEIPGKPVAKSVTGKKTDTGAEVSISGVLSFAGVGDAPFVVTIVVPATGPAMAASAQLMLPEPSRKGYLASFGLAVPLKLRFHPVPTSDAKYDKTTGAAILPRSGELVPEIRRLAERQDQTGVWGMMLWTLAGVRQSTPTSFQVWEAWSMQNPPFVLQYQNVHPGWMAVADAANAVAAGMAAMDKVAPKEIWVDSQAKVLRICFQSPYCRPAELASAPATLAAGPAYVFIEPSSADTLEPGAWHDAKKRPALTSVGQTLAMLPPTACNFGTTRATRSPLPKDPPAMPNDPEFASHEPSSPTEIALWVDETQGQDVAAFPVTRGVPLARGVLVDAKKAALFDAAGKPVPCVSRAAAYWPDRSVKWLLLDFQTPLKAGVGAKLKLVVGDKAVPAAIAKSLSVSESPGAVTVDTGKVKLTLANRAGKLAMDVGLDLNGDGAVGADETIIQGGDLLGCAFSHVKDTEHYPSGAWTDPGEADPGAAEITELKVEEQSPLHAVLLVRANLKHKLLASTIDAKQRPPAGTPVSLRLHLYANSAMVRVQHTFMFAGDVRYDCLRELGVRLPLPRQPGQRIRTAMGGIVQESPRDGEAGLLQEDPESALFWQGGKIDRGSLADGWLDVSGERWGVTVGLRSMREMFPQEIHVDDQGIWTHFYSPRVPPMDLRRYAFKYGDGESSSVGWGTAFGAMRTHEAVWFFHRGSEPAAGGAAHVKEMLWPPVARVRPRHVADTLAVGHVAEYGAATNDAHMDDALYHLPRMHRHNRDFWRWFGFWDFGDEIQVYDSARQRWGKDDGRYGWYNNEPVRDYNYHLAFLMTGNRRLWESAEAMSYHVFEADIRHASPQPFMSPSPTLAKANYSHSTTSGIDLCGGRHNCQHWSDGYFGPRLGAAPGFRLCYYQNGDPVMREHLSHIIASAMKMRRSQYMGADGDEAILWAMIVGHEMTGEVQYLDRINGYTNCQTAFAKTGGGIPAAQANWDWATNQSGAAPADPRGDLWIWSFGGSIALIETADLWGDDAVNDMICQWTLALEGLGRDGNRRDAWSNNMAACPLLAHYYRRTGDKRALDWFAKRLKGFHNNIPKDAPATDLSSEDMAHTLPAYTPNDGYGWVYTTPTFWYVGIPAWQGALRERAAK